MERSSEITGSNGSADVPPKTRDSLSKDRNNCQVRDVKTNRQRSRSEPENLRHNDVHNVHEISNTSFQDISRLCKPSYVYLTRLPDSTVKKYRPSSGVPAPEKKRRRVYRWRHGLVAKKEHKQKKLPILPLSSHLPLPAPDRISDQVEATAPDPISSSDRCQSGMTLSSTEKCAEQINQTEEIEQCDEICGFTPHEQTISPGQEFELSRTTEVNEASLNLDQLNTSELSKEHEKHIIKSPDESRITPEYTSAALLEQDNHTNRKISLQVHKDHENQVIFKQAEKRRLSPTDSDASKERKTTLSSKKFKCTPSVSLTERITIVEESNSSISDDDLASVQHKQVLSGELKRHDAKSSRSERKSNRKNFHNAMIVVNRLDGSQSPLVKKWKDKVGLLVVDDDAPISTVTRPMESRVACLPNAQHQEKSRLENSTAKCSDQNVLHEETSALLSCSQDNNVDCLNTSKTVSGTVRSDTCTVAEVKQSRLPEEVPTINIETIMCDSNDDEDDDEIMEFLSTRRRVRPSIDSSSSESISNVEEPIETQSSRVNVKSPLVNTSSSEVLSNHQRKKTRSMSRAESSKTPPLRTRRTMDWIDDSHSENKFGRDEVRSPPITRSKSRAAMDNSNHENMYWSMEDLSNCTRERETYYDPYERSRHCENYENGNRCANVSRESTPKPAQCELSRKNNNSREALSRVHSDISRIDLIQNECSNDDGDRTSRRKFTALKTSIVVLTRIEDSINLTGDKEYPRGKMKFKANGSGFIAYFTHETVDDNDIDLRSDDSGLSNSAAEPLETEHSLVNQASSYVASSIARKSVNLHDISTTDTSRKKYQQDAAIITRIERIPQDQSDNRCSQETIESDVELSLFLDEADNASPESVACNLSEGILTDSNGSNDRSIRTPSASCHEDLDEHCKRCHCEEHQREHRRLKCQNISATHKCITCNSLFKDADQLEQHRTSNAFCNSGFRCTVCKTNYMTLIELAKHRVVCAEKGMRKRNSVDQMINQESVTESRPAESTISEPPQSKNKPKKQQGHKTSSKQGRSKPRYRLDNLTCSVCSTNFDTRSDLSEHIFKHSAEELQEAYRNAKAKAMADSQVASEERKKNECKKNSDQLADSQVVDGKTAEVGRDERLSQNSVANPAQAVVSSAGSIVTTTVSNDSLQTTSTTVCSCHRDNDQTPMDKTDLQIEMVLLCKYCHVLFRRRECIELHYRMSSRCASDRTRERWARLFCANCQLTLNSWADMRSHLEVHARQNAEGTVRFVCNICRVVFVGFGALFYNHWFNHLKDTMFVAGRYNFPKVSVQPIDGSEKLPAGARSDESYIFVAEHVCTICKKPFSTRRDLETHVENSSSCRKNNMSLEVGKSPMGTDVPRLCCDVCNLTFSDRKALNDHSRTGHDHRFIHVISSPSSNNKNFMCTHCHVTKRSVRTLEEHWKTHLVRNPLPSPVEAARGAQTSEATAKEPVLVSSSVDDDQILKSRSLNALENRTNDVTPTLQTRITHEPTVITIEDEDSSPENANFFQAALETPQVENICLNNKESSVSVPSITSTEQNSVATTNSTILSNLLTKAPLLIKAVENHRAEVQALEDSCTNAKLSDDTSTKVSASTGLDEMLGKHQEKTVDDTNATPYALLSNQSSPGNMKMVLGRRRPTNAAEKSVSPSTRHPHGEVSDKTTISDWSVSKAASVDEVTTLAVIQKSASANTIENGLNVTSESNTKGKENSYSPKSVKNTKNNFSPTSLHKDRSNIPEIIEIVDEVEEIIVRETVSNVNNVTEMQYSDTDSLNKNKVNTSLGECGNSGSSQLDKNLESIKIDVTKPYSAQTNRKSNHKSSGSEMCANTAGNGPINADRSTFYSRASKASTLSFEEARWMALTASRNVNDSDSAASQKQGFLRVKNLSELRAVKTHTCLSCNARFESQKSLTEHQQVHMCGVLDKDVQYPKGITAALVLPDSLERAQTPENTLSASDTSGCMSTRSLRGRLTTPNNATTLTTPSYASPQLIGVLSSQGAAVDTLASNVVVTNDSIGTWVQAPVDSVTRVESANSLQNVSLVMDLGSQQQVNNPLNNLMPTPVLISSTSIAQSQDDLVRQQSQPLISSVGTLVIPENNQRLLDNRTGTIGYHVLPPMVVLPSSQATKHHRNVAHPISSSNYLPTSGSVNNSPLTYQNEGVNKLLCNICHTFQCDNLEAFNNHVTKHYTGWNKTMTQNSIQLTASTTTTPSVIVPTTTSFAMIQETPRPVLPNETNQIGSQTIFNNWTVKDTPHGPLLVTPVSAAISDQTMTSFVLSNNRSVIRPSHDSTSPMTSNYGQIVYRCMICKSALYKNYPPLRNHVILVHGITDFAARGVENIVQKSYHCTLCPNTTALFDSEEKFRAHTDSVHAHTCPSCRRVFVSFLSLKSHLEHCRASACNDRSAFGSKC